MYPTKEEKVKNVSIKEEKREEPVYYVEVISEEKVLKIELEEYLIGVVASEMPYSFEMEALKAQSVAARTFVMQRGLKVDNTTATQVYRSEAELKEIHHENYDVLYERVKQAVDATTNEVLMYDQQYISALFYSCNNGKSNDAAWYYGNEKPYLKSVESSWDLEYEGCKSSVEKKKIEILEALQISEFNVSNPILYENGYVKSITIGGKVFSGREVREKLGLRSSCFSFTDYGEYVLIQCMGYGHGVGMSQYGANGMAKEGYTYDEILKHYYTGVEITTIS